MKLHGLVAATHTPFDDDGELNLAVVERQAEHLLRSGVKIAFVGGSTGESHSLSRDERMALTHRWSEVVRGTDLTLVVHVGGNCLSDARVLAAHAEHEGAAAIAALAPSYFKPGSVQTLVDSCAEIAGGAPSLPFYFYDIPALTGVQFPMPDFLGAAAERIPNLAGVKFTNLDLMAYQETLHCQGGRFDIPWGVDEALLAALALGARGAVGSSYNFAAPVYLRVMDGFARGELAAAREAQLQSVNLIHLLASYGYMAAAKTTMGFLGVPVGQPRLPIAPLSTERQAELRADLDAMGFFARMTV